MYFKITLHSAAAEEIIKKYITFLDPGGINYVIIVGPTVVLKTSSGERKCGNYRSPDPPTLAFLENSKGNPEKGKGFLSSRNP